jgi:hypothetical protein
LPRFKLCRTAGFAVAAVAAAKPRAGHPQIRRGGGFVRRRIILPQAAQLARGIGKRGIKHQSALIRQTRFGNLPFEL